MYPIAPLASALLTLLINNHKINNTNNQILWKNKYSKTKYAQKEAQNKRQGQCNSKIEMAIQTIYVKMCQFVANGSNG